MPQLLSVNVGRPQPNPYKETKATGIGKEPQSEPVQVRAPGPKRGGLGSGLVGDFIGDVKHHGGDGQAVYAFQREDLDRWAAGWAESWRNGFFGENLTTVGLEVNEARLGERWQVGGEVVLQVISARIPCSTFRGWVGERGWLKTFTADAATGRVPVGDHARADPGGDEIRVIHRPAHEVTVSQMFRAFTTERDLLPGLLAAGDDLDAETQAEIAAAAAESAQQLDDPVVAARPGGTPRAVSPRGILDGLVDAGRTSSSTVRWCAGPPSPRITASCSAV